MGFFFTFFYQPIANLLFFILDILNTNSVVLGIIIFVFIIRLVLLPLVVKTYKTQIAVQLISEKLKKIKEETKDKKEQSEATLKIYKEAGINPLTPFLLIIVQICIFLAAFFVIKDIGQEVFDFSTIYSSIMANQDFGRILFGFDLFLKGGIVFAVLVGVTQFIALKLSQSNLSSTGNKELQSFQKIILYVLPLVVGAVTFAFVALVGFYWLMINIATILQELFILKPLRLKLKSPQS